MSRGVKWRVAQIISGIQLVVSLLLTCSLTYALWQDRHTSYSSTDTLVTIIAYAVLLFMISFTLFMVFAIQKHYPDKLFSPAVNRLFVINWFLYAAATICAVLILFFGIRAVLNSMELYKSYPYANTNSLIRRQIITLGIFFVWLVLMIWLLVIAIKFRRFIRKNFAAKQAAEIDMLGSGKE